MGASMSEAVFAPVVAFGAAVVVIVSVAGAAIVTEAIERARDRFNTPQPPGDDHLDPAPGEARFRHGQARRWA